MRKTKIICTLGPSTDSYDTLCKMAKAGMNVVRFNMAHGDYDTANKRMELVKKVRDDLNIPLGIMVDIKGPEVRTGQVDVPFKVEKGDKLIIKAASILVNTQLENSEIMRTDGNEYLIYLVGYQEKQVVSYIRKLYKEFKNLPYEHGAAIGYSMITNDMKTIEDSINESIEDMRNKKDEIDEG